MNNKSIHILCKPNATQDTNSFNPYPIYTYILAIIILSERQIIAEV